MGWQGETHSVAGAARTKNEANLAVRNKLISQMSFGTGHTCDQPMDIGKAAPSIATSAASTSASSAAVMPPPYPGEWVAKYDKSNELNYMHMAMIETLHNGSLALAWQTAPKIEGDKRQHIVLTFATPATVAETREGAPYLSWAPPVKVDAIGGSGGQGAPYTAPPLSFSSTGKPPLRTCNSTQVIPL